VLPENRGELGEERDLAHRGSRLRWDAVWRHSVAASRELVAHVDDPGGEVNVVPAQPQHFGEPHPGVRAGDEQRPVSARTSGEESNELCAGQDALVGAQWMRSFVALEPVEWMGRDVAAAKREREDAAEGAEDALDRPRRKPIGLQLAHECDDIVGRDQSEAAKAEPR